MLKSCLKIVQEGDLNKTSWREVAQTEDIYDKISSSIERMKCLVPSIVNITAEQTIHRLVDQETLTFSSEFQAILNDSDVLLTLKRLIKRDIRISGCAVYTNVTCLPFGVDVDVQIKSVTYELVHLLNELQDAFDRL